VIAAFALLGCAGLLLGAGALAGPGAAPGGCRVAGTEQLGGRIGGSRRPDVSGADQATRLATCVTSGRASYALPGGAALAGAGVALGLA